MDYITKMNRARNVKGLSIRQLGLDSGLSEPAVKNILSQKCSPNVGSVKKISDVLGLSLSQLFCSEGEIVMKSNSDARLLVDECGSLSENAVKTLLWIACNLRR